MSEKAIAFVAAEWEALGGLPHMQRCLYLVLRWYMDRMTGRVGDTRGISLQGLGEELYVEPVRGRHASESGSPSKKAVRSALDGLERVGLIRACGNGEVLVFFLPKARRASARQKHEGHMRGTDEGHNEFRHDGYSQTQAGQRIRGYEGHDEGHDEGHGLNGDEGHTSSKRVNHLYEQAVAPAQRKSAELSTVPLLAAPLDGARVAEWIRLHEQRRGCRARFVASDKRITNWISKGVTPQQLAEAYDLAKIDREVTKNPSPLNPAFLDIFVQRVFDEGEVFRGGRVSAVDDWSASWNGLSRRADELGIPPVDSASGEGFAAFKRRVMAAHERAASVRRVA